MKRLEPGIPLARIAELAGASLVRGDPQLGIHSLATLASAQAGDISFLASPRYLERARTTAASGLIAREADLLHLPSGCAVLVSEDPYRSFAALSRSFAQMLEPPRLSGRHPSAVIADSARIGSDVSIHPQVVVGEGAWIGDGVTVGAGAIVGADCHIGDGTVLHPRVTIYQGCSVGQRCIVHSGVVIGADGFGFAPAEGHWEKIPQLGGVRIGDDVEIGANTTIDRGALDDTVIDDGCKLDNQIQIGHNVRIGAGTAIAGCVGVAGSAVIGRRCRIGGGAGIAGHIDICDDVTISAMSVVLRSIRKPGFYSGIFPIMENPDWERAAAALRRLPALRVQVRRLGRTDEEESS
jgi:UDP-3-O-[3-hydroxymyristoyl] glucosamine N-acyltransferase